jgi:aryl-alcohol dehydrogenase-like predicted oxidoreductase
MGSMDKESTFKLLDAFYEAGGNAIDTANNYQDEESETWIGEWIQKKHQENPKANFRDQIVIASKYTTKSVYIFTCD